VEAVEDKKSTLSINPRSKQVLKPEILSDLNNIRTTMTDRLTDDTGGEVCEVCDRHVPDNVPVLFWCNVCEQVLCDDCWDLQPVHRKKTTHRTKVKTHERTELKIADLILSIFSAGRDVEEQLHGHENNLDTKWFGVISSDDEQLNPQLYNFERFRALIYGSFVDSTNQFPSLISFVGDTGAGKSTLINALIKVTVRMPLIRELN